MKILHIVLHSEENRLEILTYLHEIKGKNT